MIKSVYLKTRASRHIIAILAPALTGAAFLIGGPIAVFGTACLLSLALSLLFVSKPSTSPVISPLGTIERPHFLNTLDQQLVTRETTGQGGLCIVMQLDDYGPLVDQHGMAAAEKVIKSAIGRIRAELRQDDHICQLDAARIAVALTPRFRVNLETGLQVSGRLQAALAEPYSIDGARVYASASIGFALLSRIPTPSADKYLECAEIALKDARRSGPASIRAYSKQIANSISAEADLLKDIRTAFENREIVAWFQPQLDTSTGEVSGFEALARWRHPEKGMVAPNAFLPAIQDAGLMDSLNETMMTCAMEALVAWDRAGISIPSVGVNFSTDELRDPKLTERLSWELDRFGLAPQRLTIEILETVIAGVDDDVIVSNISQLAAMGCSIDLDDFGTGHASIAAIKRFAIDRIKIDRSFVTRIDQDQNQQAMLSAILSMAEQINLETLAEGVETLSEHAMLAQLGCSHVQGFGIAKPMPFEETIKWIEGYKSKTQAAHELKRRFG